MNDILITEITLLSSKMQIKVGLIFILRNMQLRSETILNTSPGKNNQKNLTLADTLCLIMLKSYSLEIGALG